MAGTLHVRKNDNVIVIAGDNSGKRGRVLKAIPKRGKVVVEGVNYIKKHLRKSRQNPRGGIVEKESPIDVSNVMLVCPHCSKPTRAMTTRLGESHERGRVCKKCRQVIGAPEKK